MLDLVHIILILEFQNLTLLKCRKLQDDRYCSGVGLSWRFKFELASIVTSSSCDQATKTGGKTNETQIDPWVISQPPISMLIILKSGRLSL